MRGPSAGGSGQDNVYLFDGANVSLPLFGNLSAEPASHDIAQVTVITGGARAVDFNRSGGFSIDSVSKSGTSAFHGEAELPVPDRRHVRELEHRHPVAVRAGSKMVERGRSAARSSPTSSYFYGSYYRPEQDRETTEPTSTAIFRTTTARATKASAS